MSDSNELKFEWFRCQSMCDSNDFGCQLRFKWFGCQSMCASKDLGCLLIWTSSDAVVNWFEIEVIRLLIDLRFKWFGCQSIWDSNELFVNWFEIQAIWLSTDLRFKWVGCQWIWYSNGLVVNRCVIRVSWLSMDSRFKWFGCQSMCVFLTFRLILFVNWFEIQVIRLSVDVWLKWFGCEVIWDSSDLAVSWFEIQMNWLSKTKLFCETSFKIEALKFKNEAFVRDFLHKWRFEGQKRSFCARLPSKTKLCSWKTKLLCEIFFKNGALKIKNEAFLRDFLQERNFGDQKWRLSLRDFLQNWSKRSISARLPSKMKLWSFKTKLFCETSFKNEALKLKNEAFLRDFLQKWHVDQTLGLRITIRFSDFQLDASKVLCLSRKSWAEAYELL